MMPSEPELEQAALSIVHELAQPLSIISLVADSLVKLPNRTADEVKRNALLVLEQADRISDITRRLQPRRQPTMLNAVVQESLYLAFLTHPCSVEKIVELDDRIGLVRLDKRQIEQVLTNLIRNSLEAMQDNDGQYLIIRTTHANTHVEISVIDDGPGINQKIAGRLFQPYTTSKPEGLGLGLSISETIVKAHGGTIAVRPSDHGACFVVTLPLDG